MISCTEESQPKPKFFLLRKLYEEKRRSTYSKSFGRILEIKMKPQNLDYLISKKTWLSDARYT